MRTQFTPDEQRLGEWPDPDLSVLSDHRAAAPALPLDVFGGYWREWIKDQAQAKSCAPDYVALGLLSCASALIGTARWGSPWEGWIEPCILWTAGVGTPSSGKSPGLDATLEVVAAIESDLNEHYPGLVDEWKTKSTVAKATNDVWEADIKSALRRRAKFPASRRMRRHLSDLAGVGSSPTILLSRSCSTRRSKSQGTASVPR